jgi:hypothetical protein
VGQHVRFGVVYQVCQFRQSWASLVGGYVPQLAGGRCIVLGKSSADPGRGTMTRCDADRLIALANS